MPRSSVLLVDFRRMQRLPEESSVVLRLMMAANDILVSDAALRYFTGLESDRTLKLGRRRYFVNLQCGHLSEAVNHIIPAIDKSGLLRSCVAGCNARVRDAYELLVELAPHGSSRCDFEATMKAIRDKLTFHYYDKEKRLIRKGLDSCAENPDRSLSKIVYSDDGSRFVAADVLNDEIVTRHLWKIPADQDSEEAAKERLDEMSRWARTFMEFVEGFVWEFANRHCAAR